jgi:hypothetical protein
MHAALPAEAGGGGVVDGVVDAVSPAGSAGSTPGGRVAAMSLAERFSTRRARTPTAGLDCVVETSPVPTSW